MFHQRNATSEWENGKKQPKALYETIRRVGSSEACKKKRITHHEGESLQGKSRNALSVYVS